MRKCFLDNLPKKEGIGKNKGKMIIDWNNSIGYNVEFVYDNVTGIIHICNYSKSNVCVEYNNEIFNITTDQIKKCQLGRVVGKYTNKFKMMDDKILDDKRDLNILNKKRVGKIKYYKYHCNKCGNEDWISESNLLTKNKGCNTCCNPPRKLVLGINTIWDTDRWMCDLGISEEDAKTHTKCSGDKVIVTCPNCGKQKQIVINKVYNRKSISCSCNDGISYPEKFIISLLEQLNIKYIKEYKPEWSNNKRYDFYITDYNTIIECHGRQHYDSYGFKTCNGRTLQEEQNNDQYKKELALNNNINNYITLDCRNSELEWIKQSIINSELNDLFDLNKVDWLKCEEFAINSNKVKEICEYWKIHNRVNNENLTLKDIGNIFNLGRDTVGKYLKKGSLLGWCDYNSNYKNF